MWDRIISDDPFWMRYVPDQYKRQQIFDDSLAVLKFVPDCFVTSKMIKLLFTPLYAGQSRLYENSCNVVFNCNGMGILNKALNNINLDDTSYDENDPDTIIHIRLLENARHLKSS